MFTGILQLEFVTILHTECINNNMYNQTVRRKNAYYRILRLTVHGKIQ